jgi:peptidoglycan/xylan/chitin deacetylase (PgdA/CDA1 family)
LAAEPDSDVLVLGYHAVSAAWPSPLAVSPEHFQKHLSLLARRGYRGVTFLEAVTGPPAGRCLAVTFDDAYKSILEAAAPILKAFRLPATVFVPTAFASSGEPLAWPGTDSWLETEYAVELEPMTWDDLRKLGHSGWEIGSHSRTHPKLVELDDAALADELRRSREDIESALDRPCATLAYPYGEHDHRVVAAAEAAGYRAAATRPARLNEGSALRWPRVGIYRVDAPWRFAAKVSPTVRRLRSGATWERLRSRQFGIRRRSG